MYYLLCDTTLENLTKILENKALLSLNKNKASSNHSYSPKNEREDFLKEYRDKIFTSLLFPIKDISKINENYKKNEYSWKNMYYKSIYLIFDYEKVMNYMSDKEINFYCSGGSYGRFIEGNCVKYDSNISPNQNAKNWIHKDKIFFKNRLEDDLFNSNATLGNSIVFHDILPLFINESEEMEMLLKYIYIHIPNEYKECYEACINVFSDEDSEEYPLWTMEEVNKIEELKNKYSQYEWRIDLGEPNKEIPFCI